MQENNSKVSVVIPTYNRRNFIQQAIESVLNQTYKDYEIIIVDDASTDGTTDWLTTTYPDIKVISLTKNCGAPRARNEGIRAAKGDIVAFLDSDDQWLPNYLEKQIEALKANPSAIFSFCNYSRQIKKANKIIKTDKYIYKPKPQYLDFIHHQIMKSLILTMSSVIIYRQALVKAGYLNEQLKNCHDIELYLRLLKFGELIHVPEELLIKIQHTGSISGNKRKWAKYQFMVLDIFFSSPNSKPYKHLETEARYTWAKRIANYSSWEQNFFLILELRTKAFWFSSKLKFQKILNKLFVY